MRKTVVAVFAHPDDEAFGPAGTLAKLSQKNDVYLICVTGGELGKNNLKHSEKEISKIRKKELLKSAKILGIKKAYWLGFVDGTLSNSLYHNIAKKLKGKFDELKPDIVITFEPHGISGHIDHIAVSFVVTYVVSHMQTIKNLYYYCILEKEHRRKPRDYFIYSPRGYSKSETDWEVDINDVWDVKVKAMLAHRSQKHDSDVILNVLEKLPKKEYFLKFKA